MFEIIRIYVKENINVDAATITSDYSFHFEVKKKIGLAEPYNKLYNTNTFVKSFLSKIDESKIFNFEVRGDKRESK